MIETKVAIWRGINGREEIIPKGKQKLTDDELSRISGGEDGTRFICYKCGGIEFPDASDLMKHNIEYHEPQKRRNDNYDILIDPVK